MAKIPRVLQKIFGRTAASGEFGIIGSKASGSPSTSKDLAAIQTDPKYLEGIFSITSDQGTSRLPYTEDINSLFFLTTSMIKYLYQSGVPEWISTEPYYANISIVLYNGVLWKASEGDDTTPNEGNEPSTNLDKWTPLTEAGLNIQNLRLFEGKEDGQQIVLSGYTTNGDTVIPPYYWNSAASDDDNGGTIIKPTATSGNGRWIMGNVSPINVRWFGATGDGVVDDTLAIQNALNTGKTVFLPKGDYRITNELLMITPGQILYGEGEGQFFDEDIKGYQTKIIIDKDDTIPAYIKTRRQAPETSSDLNDVAMSCAINIQGEGVRISGFILQLDCDYTDLNPSNLGGNCDVGIFIGTRTEVNLLNINVIGYFRIASIYMDVTYSTTLPMFTTPGGVTYPDVLTSGSDRIMMSKIHTKGGLKGLFIAGAKQSSSGDYYDFITDTIYSSNGGRGGGGASDFLADNNCFFESRDHHSGYRATDPTMNPATETVDLIACCVAIDGRRGSSSQQRVRRIRFTNVRLRTLEAARMFTDRVYELDVTWFHSEADRHTAAIYDTSGVDITTDINNYDTTSYGPIVCVPTSGVGEGTNQVSCRDVWGTGVQPQWSDDLVELFTYTRGYVDRGDWVPEFSLATVGGYTKQEGKWYSKDGLIYLDFEIEYTGLDTADNSPITISGLPVTITTGSTVEGALSLPYSPGIVPTTSYGFIITNDISAVATVRIADSNGVYREYNDGDIQASGTIIGSFTFRDF